MAASDSETAFVAVEAVAESRKLVLRDFDVATEPLTLYQINVEVSVAVVVQESSSGAHDLGEVVATAATVGVDKLDARVLKLLEGIDLAGQ
jgi:hypothetical protein